MDILVLILTCSFIHDEKLIQAIINVQSTQYVLCVTDITRKVPPSYSETLEDAKKAIDLINLKGGRALIGYMGIPADEAFKYGKSPYDLLDSCVNISIGTSILSELATQCNPDSRKELIRKYSNYIGHKGDYFTEAVLSNIEFLESRKLIDPDIEYDEIESVLKVTEYNSNNSNPVSGNDSNSLFMDDVIFEITKVNDLTTTP